MSWIEKLYQTYENNLEHIADPNDPTPLWPLYHSTQNAQIHIVLDGEGHYVRASPVTKEDAQTIIPTTEESAGRSGSKIAPHPLFDTLQYVAGDYLTWGGNPKKNKNKSGNEPYILALRDWADWGNNQKLHSLLKYLSKNCLITDLVKHKVLFGDSEGKLIEKWTGEQEEPPIFKIIKLAQKGQFEAFVRFSVEIPEMMPSELWKDPTLQSSWREYYRTQQARKNLCVVLGEKTNIATNHPKNIRYPGDGAKLITSNDTEGYTYLGRFTNAQEACCVGVEVTQKAHSALRWLIDRQGSRTGDRDQAIVAWAVSGLAIPDPFADTAALLSGKKIDPVTTQTGDTAQDIGIRFSQLISGYSVKLDPSDHIVVMGLDSATPGRMSIRFYRELKGSEFLERVQVWHTGCCWLQRFSKEKVFVGAPAPRDIAEAAYGKPIGKNTSLRKATVERLLPCIIDGVAIPRDLVISCVRRASNKNGLEPWEWEKTLGITCALFRHQHKERSYQMSLERDRKTRDYLYGRLLALAEHLEGRALYAGSETRETNAGRLMQRFSERPYSTWRNIETSLTPYKTRLRAKRGGFLHNMEKEMDEVACAFDTDEFISDKPLTGEFLLAYHCQRAALWKGKPDDNLKDDTLDIEEQS